MMSILVPDGLGGQFKAVFPSGNHRPGHPIPQQHLWNENEARFFDRSLSCLFHQRHNKYYVKRMYEKLHVHSMSAAVVKALKEGLI